MYEKMTDEDDDTCAICLEVLGDDTSYQLADKFGCDCKQRIHEKCLTEWVTRKMTETGSNSAGCIMCRQEAGVWNMQEYADTIVTVGDQNDRLRAILAEHNERRERMIALRMRVAGIMCIVMVLSIFLLSLAGVID